MAPQDILPREDDPADDSDDGYENDVENMPLETNEFAYLKWGEFSYNRFDKPTDRFDQRNYTLTEWEMFLLYG